LKAFRDLAKKKVRTILIYRGTTKQIRDDIEVLPYEEFLKEIEKL
jgi:hypothetical protein